MRVTAWEEARESVLVVLDRVMALIHREEKGFAAARTVPGARARDARRAVRAVARGSRARDEDGSRARCVPTPSSLALVDGWNVLDDDRCAYLARRDHAGVRSAAGAGGASRQARARGRSAAAGAGSARSRPCGPAPPVRLPRDRACGRGRRPGRGGGAGRRGGACGPGCRRWPQRARDCRRTRGPRRGRRPLGAGGRGGAHSRRRRRLSWPAPPRRRRRRRASGLGARAAAASPPPATMVRLDAGLPTGAHAAAAGGRRATPGAPPGSSLVVEIRLSGDKRLGGDAGSAPRARGDARASRPGDRALVDRRAKRLVRRCASAARPSADAARDYLRRFPHLLACRWQRAPSTRRPAGRGLRAAARAHREAGGGLRAGGAHAPESAVHDAARRTSPTRSARSSTSTSWPRAGSTRRTRTS